MANEFIARNGLISQNNSAITGSLTQGAPGNISSGSYSHAEGGEEPFLDVSQTITTTDYSSLGNIQFGPISGDPVFIGYGNVTLPGDLTGLISTPYTLTDLYLSSSLYSFSVDLEYFPPTPIITSVNYSGGIIITDWYSTDLNSSESIKISIRFLTMPNTPASGNKSPATPKILGATLPRNLPTLVSLNFFLGLLLMLVLFN